MKAYFSKPVSVVLGTAGIRYFLPFGLGFGLPLVALPLLAEPVRKSILKWMPNHARLLAGLAGFTLIAIGVIGLISAWALIRYYWGF